MRRLLAVAAVVVALVASCGAAKGGQRFHRNLPSFAAAWNLVAGWGAVYQSCLSIAATGGQACRSSEVAIVGRTMVDHHTAYWVEFSSPGESAEQGAHKSLFFLEKRKAIFTRAIVQAPGYGPMELPGIWMQRWTREDIKSMAGYLYAPPPKSAQQVQDTDYPQTLLLAQEWEGAPKAKDLGPETVTTPAGTFPSEHWRFRGKRGDVWVAKGAGPFGVVKAAEGDGGGLTTVTLTRRITDAKDKIVAPLRPFDKKALFGPVSKKAACDWLKKLHLPCELNR